MRSKKINLILAVIAIIGFSYKPVKAQYVTIPDSNFVYWLTVHFSGCMNGNELDTTCSQILNVTFQNINNAGISDLTGIKYFTNLDYFDCSHNQLTVLPTLPNSLSTLKCNNNSLTSLTTLPNSLVNLECKNNQLTFFNALPASLQTFWCSGNQLTGLPILPDSLKVLSCPFTQLTFLPSLPNNLQQLYCNNNQLSSLPELPGSMQILNCNYNQLHSLPVLQNSLIELHCGNNQLTNLPTLPLTLEYLDCEENLLSNLPSLSSSLLLLSCNNNQLQVLPVLPSALVTLGCSFNQLQVLPALPNTLKSLWCAVNQLTSLPDLPDSLFIFNCSNNYSLTCLPTLPESLIDSSSFNIHNTAITCLPNYVLAMDAVVSALPVCQINDYVNNPGGCQSAEGIAGWVYEDTNSDCELNGGDDLIKNVPLKFYNTGTSQFGITNSKNNGYFFYPTSVGNYIVIVDTLNKPYESNCLYPGVDTTLVTTLANPLAGSVNFDVKCKPVLDLGVQSILHHNGIVFPGQQHTLNVIAGHTSQWFGLNCFSSAGSGQVEITVTGPVTFNGAAIGALTPSTNGNVFTYSISDFDSINSISDFQLLFTTNINAQAGDQICVHVEITQLAGDINPLNNIKDYCYTVVNSMDPNYKEVYPKDVLPGFDDWLTYTIHFQNTGNAPAINIRVLDTLDTNLDAATFEVINYSHFNNFTLMNGVLDFRFPNILLPDSTSNLAGSQGFVQYRIKPVSNLPEGTQIENTANIYFDYNAPITTNTTVNNFLTTVGSNEKIQALDLLLFPNPSTGLFNLSATANVEVYNIVGELISTLNNAKTIDLSNEPNGVYFVKLNGTTSKKLIKK